MMLIYLASTKRNNTSYCLFLSKLKLNIVYLRLPYRPLFVPYRPLFVPYSYRPPFFSYRPLFVPYRPVFVPYRPIFVLVGHYAEDFWQNRAYFLGLSRIWATRILSYEYICKNLTLKLGF